MTPEQPSSSPWSQALSVLRFLHQQWILLSWRLRLRLQLDWQHGIQALLERLLHQLDVGRAYIFERFETRQGELCMRQRFEQVAEGVRAEIDNPALQAVPVDADGLRPWAQTLSRQAPIVVESLEQLSETERAFLSAQGICACLIYPIWVDGQAWGFVGVDELRHARQWQATEIAMLQAVARILERRIGHGRELN